MPHDLASRASVRGKSPSMPRPWRAAVLAASLILAACADDPVAPLAGDQDHDDVARSFAVHLTCTVDVERGSMGCDPSSPSGAAGPNMNLVVGSQHQFVRMASDSVWVSDGFWHADVTVQNLTLQPFGTSDGENADPAGVRVFFVDEPGNGVEVVNPDGTDTFLDGTPAKFHSYFKDALGEDAILSPGEVSAARPWAFRLNGATSFQFSVLVSTVVPDPGAIGVHITRVSAGGEHACGDGADGRVYCWGKNTYGQLGDGTRTDRSTPVAVDAPGNVKLSGVSAGATHSCAEGDDQLLYCWGRNTFGKLGDNSTVDRSTPVPVDVSGLPAGVTLSGVSVGAVHTCALGSNGSVYCWGGNNDGQLGNDATGNRQVPDSVAAPGDMTFTRVSAGSNNVCAEGTDAQLYCWGSNEGGKLGIGGSDATRVPDSVAAPDGVTLSRAATSRFHTCAEGTDGTDTQLYCWGENGPGRLGNGMASSAGSSDIPVPVQSGESILVSVTTGMHSTCAEDSNGGIYCWGSNTSGQLGIGGGVSSLVPAAVHAPAGVKLSDVSAGSEFACAVAPNGVYCWGRNSNGQLGDGTTTNRLTPVVVAGTRGK